MNGPDGKKFVWGKVLEVIEVGSYEIVKAATRETPETPSAVIFHPYVNGKDTNSAAASLQGALILAIAHSNVAGPDVDAMARAASKILNVVG